MSWIKMRNNLKDDPRVIQLSIKLDLPEVHICGCLFALWSWADQHTEEGNAISVTKSWIDRYIGVTMFAQSMIEIGWLDGEDGNLSIPNFIEHNGDSAKKRMQTAKRVAKSRTKPPETKEVAKCNANTVTPSVTLALPREDKRREDKRREDTSKKTSFIPPTYPEFEEYLKETLPEINPDWTPSRIIGASKNQYNTYVENNWKDGNDKPIKNWKTKARNALLHHKPWNYGNTPKQYQATSFTELNAKAKSDQLSKNLQNPLF